MTKKIVVDFSAILDWAERDQDECRRLADDEKSEREAKANLKMIAIARKQYESPHIEDPADPEFQPMCAYCLNFDTDGHQSDCERPRLKSTMRFECCGRGAKKKSDICKLHDGRAEPCAPEQVRR